MLSAHHAAAMVESSPYLPVQNKGKIVSWTTTHEVKITKGLAEVRRNGIIVARYSSPWEIQLIQLAVLARLESEPVHH